MHYSRALMLLYHTVQWLIMIHRFCFRLSQIANHIWQWQAAAKLNTHWQAQDKNGLDGQRRIAL
jgi:hypothetical protein